MQQSSMLCLVLVQLKSLQCVGLMGRLVTERLSPVFLSGRISVYFSKIILFLCFWTEQHTQWCAASKGTCSSLQDGGRQRSSKSPAVKVLPSFTKRMTDSDFKRSAGRTSIFRRNVEQNTKISSCSDSETRTVWFSRHRTLDPHTQVGRPSGENPSNLSQSV